MNSKQTNLTSPQDTEFFGDDIEISEDQAEGNFHSSADEEEELFEDVEEGLNESTLREEKSIPKEEQRKNPPVSSGTPEPGYYRRAPVHTWFCTFMIMNLPIIGWIYLLILALKKNGDQRRDFAKAYLVYKLVFLIVALAILAVFLYVGLELADNLLEYMEML